MFLVGKNNKISAKKSPCSSIHLFLFIIYFWFVCLYLTLWLPCHKTFSRSLWQFIYLFFFSILLGSHIGDHPQEELAKFSYSSLTVVKQLKILPYSGDLVKPGFFFFFFFFRKFCEVGGLAIRHEKHYGLLV